MIALTLFTLLDDQEDDSLASGGKVECLHIVISYVFGKFLSIIISDAQHFVDNSSCTLTINSFFF